MNLQSAVSTIYQIVQGCKGRGEPSPFFFIAGAGISSPPVKTASEIVEECRQIVLDNEITAPPPSERPGDIYAYYLKLAHPGARGIQEYLRTMMDGLWISKANLRLAHLLLDGQLGQTVFTPNFDDMLERSVRLFGGTPLVCDHPATAERMRVGCKDIQILHVHGSYWFYDCVNDENDIKTRARNVAMRSVLDHFLFEHVPIVIGYSGWEGDLIMTALEKRLALEHRLPFDIFWFCYRKPTLDRYPAWLWNHPNVRFVFPDEPEVKAGAGPPPTPATGGSLFSTPSMAVGSSRSTPTLAADAVLDALVRKFGLEPPEFTKAPLQLYVTQLQRFLGSTSEKEIELDTFYGFHTVVERAKRAAADDKQRQLGPLQPIREAMSQADYARVCELAAELGLKTLKTPADGLELMRSLEAAWSQPKDNSPEKAQRLEVAANIGRGLMTRFSASTELAAIVAKTLVSQIREANFASRFDDALGIADEVISRFGQEQGPEFRLPLAAAIGRKGYALWATERKDEAIASWNTLVNRYGDDKEPAVREQVARALFNKAFVLDEQGKKDEAIAAYDMVLTRYGDDKEPAVREQVTKALVNKGSVLFKQEKKDEAIAAYDAIEKRYGDDEAAVVRGAIARALFNKAFVLDEQGKKDEAIAAYDMVLTRYDDDKETAMREQVAQALFNKAFVLDEQGKKDEAIAAYDMVLTRYGDDREPAVREQVTKALVNKGVALYEQDKRDEAMAAYEMVESRYGDDKEPALRERVAQALFNKAVVLDEQGKKDEANAAWDTLENRYRDDQEPGVRARVTQARARRRISKN